MDRFFDGEMSPAEEADLMQALRGDYEMRLCFRQIAIALDCIEKLPVATPAEGFARRTVTTAVTEYRRSVIRVWMVGAAMAASVIDAGSPPRATDR